MEKIMYFLLMCLYVLGTIGGIGYACYNHAYMIAAGVAAVAVMAFPRFVFFYEKLTE